MKPTQIEVIQCIVASLDEHIAPELTGSMAKSQLLTIEYLLDQLRLRVVHEAESLAGYELDARETLAHVRDVLAAGGGPPFDAVQRQIDRCLHADIPAGPAAYATASLEDRTTALRGCIDEALQALVAAEPEAEEDAQVVQARRALHDCTARQLDREARWLQSGYAAQRR